MTQPGGSTERFPFASPRWLEVARGVLDELVAEHGEEGMSFSVSETFTDAPAGLIGPEERVAAWNFQIVGKTVTVGEGPAKGDMQINVSYAQALPMARMVFTPQMVEMAQTAAPTPSDGQPRPPEYLVRLHNRLAEVTE